MHAHVHKYIFSMKFELFGYSASVCFIWSHKYKLGLTYTHRTTSSLPLLPAVFATVLCKRLINVNACARIHYPDPHMYMHAHITYAIAYPRQLVHMHGLIMQDANVLVYVYTL